MAVKLSPFGPKPQFVLATGLPAVGGQLFFYVAGSVNTKQTTYTDSTGLSQNTNPIVLNSLGEPTTQIWFTAGQTYKAVLAPVGDTDPPSSPIWTVDNLSGINDTTVAGQDEWVASGVTPTYVSATSFTMPGDQTTNLHVGRRVKSTVTAGTSYGTVTVAAFAALTTITVDTTGSNPLDAGLSAVSYGLLRADNFTQSAGMDVVARQGSDIVAAATLNLDAAGGDLIDVTGATGITAITLGRGRLRTVRFTGAPLITNGASLVLPGAANIQAAAGDYAIFRGYAAGVVRCVSYSRVSGFPGLFSGEATTYLGADVALNATGNYQNGPNTGSIGAASQTWLIMGTACMLDTVGACHFNVRFTDGSSFYSDTAGSSGGANLMASVSISKIITLSAATTFTLTAKNSTATTGKLLTTATNAGVNNQSTFITAVRLA